MLIKIVFLFQTALFCPLFYVVFLTEVLDFPHFMCYGVFRCYTHNAAHDYATLTTNTTEAERFPAEVLRYHLVGTPFT